MNVIYVLRLENSKFYVGRTKNTSKRISAHKKGRGSAWTSKYKPIDVVELHDNCDPYDEDKFTLKLMAEHGIENVRGGSYVTINLPDYIVNDIERRIRMATDRCLNCGCKGHFILKCTKKRKFESFKDGDSESGGSESGEGNSVEGLIKKRDCDITQKSKFLVKLEKNFVGCNVCMVDDHFTDDCTRS